MRQLYAASVMMLFISSLFTLPMDAGAQPNAVKWSTFDMGFAIPVIFQLTLFPVVSQTTRRLLCPQDYLLRLHCCS